MKTVAGWLETDEWKKKVQLSRVGRREVDAVSSFQYSFSNNLTDLLREVAYKTFSINTWKEKVPPKEESLLREGNQNIS